MYLYLASSEAQLMTGTLQIGATHDLNARRAIYQELHAPDSGAMRRIDFQMVWETTATTEEEINLYLSGSICVLPLRSFGGFELVSPLFMEGASDALCRVSGVDS